MTIPKNIVCEEQVYGGTNVALASLPRLGDLVTKDSTEVHPQRQRTTPTHSKAANRLVALIGRRLWAAEGFNVTCT